MKASSFPRWKRLFESVPNDPFHQPRQPLWLPLEMAFPPLLDDLAPSSPPERRSALLINPFYPKSPHGSCREGSHCRTIDLMAR